jgi:hypothetical protein
MVDRRNGGEARLLATVTAPVRNADAIRTALDRCGDWHALLGMAGANRVLHQLAVAVKAEGAIDGVPAPFRGLLTDLARQALVIDRIHLGALAEIVEVFARAQLRFMLLKGMALAERLYPAACERVGSDIDLLVPRDVVEPAGQLLEQLGYEPIRKEWYDRQHFHVPYHRRRGPLLTVVELHWDVVETGSCVRFDIDRWWREAHTCRLRVGTVLLPPPEEELAYLSHHAFLDGAITLRSLEDIARWVARHERAVDWKGLARRAGRSGTLHFVRQALTLGDRLWDSGGASAYARSIPGPRPLRHWLARNLVHPATVVRAGEVAWWPFRRICYWSMLDPSDAPFSALFGTTTSSDRFAAAAPDARRPRRRYERLPPLLVALALLCLPRPLLPVRFRQSRRRGAARDHAASPGADAARGSAS